LNYLEIIAFTFTLICVYLTSKQNIWCWATGIVGVIAFFILFLGEKLYFQTILQVIFFFQSVYGWYKWKKGTSGNELPVKKVRYSKLFEHLVGVVMLSVPIWGFLHIFTDTPEPYLDSLTSLMAILATYYLINKYIEAWLVWMGFNILLCTLLLHQELYIVATLEGVLFFISLNGYIQWRKDIKTVSA
jgi:nicotinamide mononucleotide transporter